MQPDPLVEESISKTELPQQSWREIQEALRGLRFGHVTVIVQNGLVVQVERLEKRRLTQPCRKN